MVVDSELTRVPDELNSIVVMFLRFESVAVTVARTDVDVCNVPEAVVTGMNAMNGRVLSISIVLVSVEFELPNSSYAVALK